MSAVRTGLLLPALALLCACGAATRPASDEDRVLAEERESKARRLAPDIYLLAERARDEARRARRRDDPETARDHDTRAGLLLSAAEAEAERIELERRGAHAGKRAEQALTRAARHLREQRRVERETRLLKASRVAQLQAEQGQERRGEGRPEAMRRERESRIRRARLLLAAAVSMNAGRGPVQAAERAIRQAESGTGTGRAAFVLARKALSAAEGALEDARARSDRRGSP